MTLTYRGSIFGFLNAFLGEHVAQAAFFYKPKNNKCCSDRKTNPYFKLATKSAGDDVF